MLEKLNLFCLTDWSNNSVAVDLIKDGSVLERKSSLKILGLSFFSKLDWNSSLSLLLKLPPRKLEPWFVLWRFFLQRFLFISMNLPYSLKWNTVLMTGKVLPGTTWICQINKKNRYLGRLIFHFLSLLYLWLINKM